MTRRKRKADTGIVEPAPGGGFMINLTAIEARIAPFSMAHRAFVSSAAFYDGIWKLPRMTKGLDEKKRAGVARCVAELWQIAGLFKLLSIGEPDDAFERTMKKQREITARLRRPRRRVRHPGRKPLDPHRPKVPDVAPLVLAYRAKPGNDAGGSLHIALADGNLDDDSIQFCLDVARERGDSDGVHLAETLQRMGITQRKKVTGY